VLDLFRVPILEVLNVGRMGLYGIKIDNAAKTIENQWYKLMSII
jgi:hypothetical protein